MQPNEDISQNKFYREVLLMMNLYHKNLVRFHTNWWEECDPKL